ncbi:ABC transporter permease [Streptomyces sp. B6B3]|uniref:ABC transporter permease n=1 Tax=Streptomyces sp. B6B3 TaxID=3153570 RepID=UPI00325DF64D
MSSLDARDHVRDDARSPARWVRPPGPDARRRLRTLGRTELTLLLRNRTALFVSLLMPVSMVLLSYSSSRQLDLAGTGLSRHEAVLSGGIGMVLMLAVYLNLVPTYVARREERVLKRLRTGELTDGEILVGAALPSAVLGVAQCAVLVVTGAVVLDIGAPRRPDLLLAGLLLGVVLLAALAAVTSALTRTVESAQITGMPLFMVSVMGSGLFVPSEVLPDGLARAFAVLPLSPVVDLVKAGWLGGMDGRETAVALGLAVLWTGYAVFAVRKWFRWDPRQ